MFEQSRETTLAYLVRAATAAESLRQRFPGRLVFCVGTESSLFTRGIVPGRSAGQRVANIRAAGLHPPSRQADISASGSGAARRVRRQAPRPPGFLVATSPWLGWLGGLLGG